MTRLLFTFILFLGITIPIATSQPIKKNLPFQSEMGNIQQMSIESPSQLELDLSYRSSSSTVDFTEFSLVDAMQTKPGYAFLASALIPGLGQAANKKWWRAGAYFVADAIFLIMHINKQNRAEELESEYEQFAANNWSVVTYSKWLVAYHKQNGIYQDNQYIDKLAQDVEGVDPAYRTSADWGIVDIELLRNVENNTPFYYYDGTAGNIFSHEMPNYGSQQYYELISKYFQYGPGWNDFGVNREGQPLDSMYQLAWDGSDMPPHFLEGARLAEEFNDTYRIAGNMLSYMLLNHVVSAFDAFITVKLKNNRLETETNFFGPNQFTLKYHF